MHRPARSLPTRCLVRRRAGRVNTTADAARPSPQRAVCRDSQRIDVHVQPGTAVRPRARAAAQRTTRSSRHLAFEQRQPRSGLKRPWGGGARRRRSSIRTTGSHVAHRAIVRGIGSRVYWVSTGGYDTHAGQGGPRILRQSHGHAGLAAAFSDIRNQGLADTTIIVFGSPAGL
jgi:uncharacterized protein (DUF1501 family)